MNNLSDIKQKFLSCVDSMKENVNIDDYNQQQALNDINILDFPNTKVESWRFTDILPLLNTNFKFYNPVYKKDYTKLIQANNYGNNSIKLVFVNGIFQAQLSDIIDDKILINNLSVIKSKYYDLVSNYLKYNNPDNDIFYAINTAYANNGAFIYIPKNVIFEKLINLIFINDTANENSFAMMKNTVVVGENSKASIIESFISSDGNYASFTNAVTEIFASDSANIDYYKIQLENEKAFQINSTHIYQSKNSSINLGTFSLDGGFVRNNLNIFLNGEYAETYPYGVYILKNKQHIDNHTFISHAKSNCTSNEIYKGIAANQSTGVFDGKILVCKDSQKTQAYQTNKNVLLSNEAKINTKPHLEIYANDVKCSHGASVGQLDNEALFYLRSRGIDKEKAKSMLVYAFLSDVVEKIKIVELKDFIDKLIVSKLQIDN